MSKLLRAFRSSLEADPGPWLLGASAILAVALWNLPIPAFLFAQEGSGSAPGCECTIDFCRDWTTNNKNRECDTLRDPWEDCRDDLGHSVNCPGKTSTYKAPLSKYVYEQGPTYCQNTKSHAGSGAGFEHDVRWWRTLFVDTKTGAGQNTVTFTPTLVIQPVGFSSNDVCANSNMPEGRLYVRAMLYAELMIDKKKAVDTSKGGGSGWDYREFSIYYDSGVWKSDFQEVEDPFTVVIDKLACKDMEADEAVEFKCRIVQAAEVPNKYVRLGKNSTNAEINLFVKSDSTACE